MGDRDEIVDLVDMTGKECYKCHKGLFLSLSEEDRVKHKLTCNRCGLRISRYKVRYTI